MKPGEIIEQEIKQLKENILFRIREFQEKTGTLIENIDYNKMFSSEEGFINIKIVFKQDFIDEEDEENEENNIYL